MKKITITVGISAYNEEQNIKFLLKSLFRQRILSGTLKEIIVVSDGSTDRTAEKVMSIKDKRVKLVNRKKRLGLNISQNEVLSKATSDVLIALDADVLPYDDNLIEELIKPILKNKKIGLVSGNTIPSTDPRTYVERVLNVSHKMKYDIYQTISSENIYLCHGRVRAFVKPLYKSIKWPHDVPEDSYSYLFATSKGYKFVFNKKARIKFRCPSTIMDHASQSLRFVDGKKYLKKYFSIQKIDTAYKIPRDVVLKKLLKYLNLSPVTLCSYIGLQAYIHAKYSPSKIEHSKYSDTRSSKKIV